MYIMTARQNCWVCPDTNGPEQTPEHSLEQSPEQTPEQGSGPGPRIDPRTHPRARVCSRARNGPQHRPGTRVPFVAVSFLNFISFIMLGLPPLGVMLLRIMILPRLPSPTAWKKCNCNVLLESVTCIGSLNSIVFL